MTYISQFSSAEAMSVSEPAASRSADGWLLSSLVSSTAKRIGAYIDRMAEFYAAATIYEELNRLSDAELRRRGLSRDTLARDVFATSEPAGRYE